MKHFNKSNASMGVAATALFIALGGPAQAASLITGANVKNSSLTGADIKNSSLTGSDVKNSSLTSSDIKNSTLTTSDIKNGTIKAGDLASGVLTSGKAGPAGPAGAAGAAGPAGPKGDVGPAGPSRWALVNRDGVIEAQSGGFRIANAYPAFPSAGEGNVYIDSGDADLSNNGIVASVALANQYSQKGNGEPGTLNSGRNGDPDNNPEFSGEVTTTKCLIPGVVVCAPADTVANGGPGTANSTNTNRHFVVSPRNSDGTSTGVTGTTGPSGTPLTTNTHKRFYVIISGPRD